MQDYRQLGNVCLALSAATIQPMNGCSMPFWQSPDVLTCRAMLAGACSAYAGLHHQRTQSGAGRAHRWSRGLDLHADGPLVPSAGPAHAPRPDWPRDQACRALR